MLVEVSDSSVEFMNITFSFYVNSKHWLCNNDGKVAGIYVYRAYTCTTVTAQMFNYAHASRCTAGRSDIHPSQDCVSAPKCRDKKVGQPCSSHMEDVFKLKLVTHTQLIIERLLQIGQSESFLVSGRQE